MTTIELQPVDPPRIEALISGDSEFERIYGLRVVPGYLAFPQALEFTREGLVSGNDPTWFTHLFIDSVAGEVVGLGGFTGPPNDGWVEIGYSIAPSRRDRGFATQAATAMIERARAAGVPVLRAHTPAGRNASGSVLTKVGLRKVLEFTDPVDGPVWRWEIALQAHEVSR